MVVGRVDRARDVLDMGDLVNSPAEDAATVWEELKCVWNHPEAEAAVDEEAYERAVVALDALLAKAEAAEAFKERRNFHRERAEEAEAERDSWERAAGDIEAERDAARTLALERADALFAAQDERDDAVRAAGKLQRQLDRLYDEAEHKLAEKERAAEQAREALAAAEGAYDEEVKACANAEHAAEQAQQRDDWLIRQLDNCINDAVLLSSVALDVSGMRALISDLKDARAALTGTAFGGDRTTEGRAGEGTDG